MLILLSPAKSLDFDAAVPAYESTLPEFLPTSTQLIKKLRGLSAKQIGKLMGLSPALSLLNHQRYAQWTPEFTKANSSPALFVFRGDVYRGMDASTFTKDDVAFAQEHLRILSGLHGVLRPLDLMQPYRLEMGTRLAVTKTKTNLYKFWGDAVTESLNAVIAERNAPAVLNLASNEYFKVVRPELMDVPIVNFQFKDLKNGTYKSIMTYAKIARGMMASYLIRNRIEKVEDILAFNQEGYRYHPELSESYNLVFTRG
jgi:cytoplasmic iron level regulating protein YaaA (DUF328/UPF0246 family)